MARGTVKDPEARKGDGIRVRLTSAERAALEETARAHGLSISDLARQRLGLAVVIGGKNATVSTQLTR